MVTVAIVSSLGRDDKIRQFAETCADMARVVCERVVHDPFVRGIRPGIDAGFEMFSFRLVASGRGDAAARCDERSFSDLFTRHECRAYYRLRRERP